MLGVALSNFKDSPAHMKTLYKVCQTKVKVWRELPDGSHNDTVAEPKYFDYIEDFVVNQVVSQRGTKAEK